jgi:hypothetical protein
LGLMKPGSAFPPRLYLARRDGGDGGLYQKPEAIYDQFSVKTVNVKKC